MSIKGKKILIYRLGSLGDTVMALPCFHKVKEVFPEADITLLTNKPVAAKAAPLEAILGSSYFFNRVLDYPVGTRNPLLLAKLIRQIRALKIDTIINLTNARSRLSSVRDYYFFKVTGIKHFIGFPQIDEDYVVSKDKATGLQEWEAKRLSRRIQELGPLNLDENAYWDLRLTGQEVQTADDLLGAYPPSLTLAISLGTKNQSNDWGLANWLFLLKNLAGLLPAWKLIVVGAADETVTAEKCILAWGKNAYNLCGKTSPRVSAAILKEAKIFIGHDSGPMHLAACVGVPCVGIFSARNLPGQWFPRGEYNKIIYKLPECAGCGLEVCIVNEKKCILSITVMEVQQAVQDIINELSVRSEFSLETTP